MKKVLVVVVVAAAAFVAGLKLGQQMGPGMDLTHTRT